MSLLSEIGIYTQDSDETVSLSEVFDRIHQQHERYPTPRLGQVARKQS
ncbi:MAG: hypothetical protein WKG07_47470 [Hymenobacter sp.]